MCRRIIRDELTNTMVVASFLEKIYNQAQKSQRRRRFLKLFHIAKDEEDIAGWKEELDYCLATFTVRSSLVFRHSLGSFALP